MLYLVELERELELQPRFFGPRLREVLEQKLVAEASNTSSSGTPFDKCCTDHPHSSCCVIFCDVPYHGSSSCSFAICRSKVPAAESMASLSPSLAWAMWGRGAYVRALDQPSLRSATAAWCSDRSRERSSTASSHLSTRCAAHFLTQCTNLPLVPNLVLPDVRQPCCSYLH